MNRKLRSTATCCIIVMMASLMTRIIAASSPPAEPRWQTGDRNQDAALKYLRPALFSANKSGRFYYFTACDGPRLPFPRISVQPFPKNKKGLEAVRHIFKPDQAVTVTELGDDIIRVNVGKAPNPILQTKIRLLRLNPREQYTSDLAVLAINNTNEVKAAAATLGLQRPIVVSSIRIMEPMKGLPHLPASMKDVTMDQALDAVAKTFGVIVVFGECAARTGNHLYDLYVLGID